MVSIIWTEEVLSDVDNIAAYISKDSVFYARQFVQKLFAATTKPELYPSIGKPLYELPVSIYKEILLKNTGSSIVLITLMFTLSVFIIQQDF